MNEYWISSISSNWNNSSNWSLSSGGLSGAPVPGIGSIVIFDGSGGGSCLIDTSVSINSLYITSDYTSSITQNNNSVLITAMASFDGGSFLSGGSSIGVGSVYLGYGNLQDVTVSASQDVSCASSHNQWSTLNNSLLVMNGSGQQKVYSEAGGVIPALKIEKTDSNQILCYGDSPITIKDYFLLQDGTFNTNGLDIQVGI